MWGGGGGALDEDPKKIPRRDSKRVEERAAVEGFPGGEHPSSAALASPVADQFPESGARSLSSQSGTCTGRGIILLTSPSPVSRCFNMDEEGVSAE